MIRSLNVWLATAALACLAPTPANGAANAPDLLVFQHENLSTGQVQALDSMRGKASILLFFQPDCDWCFRQTRVVNGLLESCPDALGAAALGVHGNRHNLKKELKRLRPKFDAYKTGSVMQQELKGVPATPVMLLTDPDGLFLQVFSGYIPDDELRGHLEALLGKKCGGKKT